MAKGQKKSRYLIVKLTEDEFTELNSVAGHYKKSDYVRKAIKIQIASDKIRGNAKD